MNASDSVTVDLTENGLEIVVKSKSGNPICRFFYDEPQLLTANDWKILLAGDAPLKPHVIGHSGNNSSCYISRNQDGYVFEVTCSGGGGGGSCEFMITNEHSAQLREGLALVMNKF